MVNFAELVQFIFSVAIVVYIAAVALVLITMPKDASGYYKAFTCACIKSACSLALCVLVLLGICRIILF